MNRFLSYAYFALVIVAFYGLSWVKAIFGDINYPPLKPSVRFPYLMIFSVIFICFALLLKRSGRFNFLKARNILTISLFLGLLLIMIGPLLSQDFKNYIMQARILSVYRENPYYVAVEKFPGDPFAKGVFWSWATTAYGPFWVILSSAFIFFAKDSFFLSYFLLKLIPFLSYLGLIWQIDKLQADTGNKNRTYLPFFFAFNPFILLHFLVDGHNDILMSFLIIFSLYILVKKNNFVLSAVIFTFAALIKYIPLILLPIFLLYLISTAGFKKAVNYLAVILAATIALFLPFFRGWNIFDMILRHKFSMGIYSNTLPYALSLLLNFCRLSRSPDPSFPPQWVFILFHLCFLFAYIAIIALFWRSDKTLKDIATASALIIIAYLTFESFQLGEWYLIWLLPFLLLSGIKGKEFLAAAMSFAGMVGFYKRISFLLVLVLALYSLYLFVRRKLYFTPATIRNKPAT